MAWFETWFKNDLAKPINVVQLQGVMFNLDNLANKIGVELEYNGQPAALEGTIAGYVIRNDGTTLNLTNTNTGKELNKAWVILPQEAYTVEGPISIVIKLVYNSAETTIGACAGYVTRSRTSSEIAPTGTVIPSLASLEAAIAAANAAAVNAADATDYIAPTEGDSTADAAHAVGAYFIYDGKLMKATSAIAQGATIVPYASGVTNYNCVEVPNGLSGDVYNVNNTANAAANNAADAQRLVASLESFAGMPTGPATNAHATGSYFVFGGVLYKATSDIAIGDPIVTTGTGANAAQVPGGVMGEVADLESALKATAKLNTGNTILYDITIGKRFNTSGSVNINSPETQNGWGCVSVPAAENDIFVITGKGGSSSYLLWSFVDSSGAKLLTSAGSANVENVKLTAPAGTVYLVVNFDLSSPYGLIGGDSVVNRLAALDKVIEQETSDMDYFRVSEANISSVAITPVTGYAIRNSEGNAYNGDITTSSNAAYCSIAVTPGERYLVTTRAGSYYSAVAFFDSSTFDRTHYIGTNEYQASTTTINDMMVSIPSGVTYMGINTINYSDYPISVKKITPLKIVDALYQAGFGYQSDIDKIRDKYNYMEECQKVGDPSVTRNAYMNGRNIVTNAADSYSLTDYFEIQPGDTFFLTFVYRITLFDSNKTYSQEIKVSTLSDYTGSVRSNKWTATTSGYVRFSINNTTSPYWGAATKITTNAPYSIVCLGDSIFGHGVKPYDIPTYIQNATNLKTANCAFGGTRASETTAIQYRPLSFCNIAEAINTEDWTDIDIDWSSLYGDDIFMVPKDVLVNMDWSNVRAITIAYGTNDMNGDVVIDNGNDPYDKTTFKGALRYGIEKILNKYPMITLILLSPLYRYRSPGTDYSIIDYDSDTGNGSGGFIMQPYLTALQEIANEYHLPYFDNYNGVALNKITAKTWLSDGTHLNRFTGTPKVGAAIGEEVAMLVNDNHPKD